MICLDCTCRDGGYYNNWNFSLNLVNDYLKVMEEIKIHAVEIGFRSPPGKLIGDFAKVTDDFIEDNLYIPTVDYFGVMINAGEINSDMIRKLFKYADESPINLVRVATHFKDVDLAEIILRDLKDLGYTTTINLMQSAGRSFGEIAHVAEKIQCWDVVDVLYIADSLGGMDHDMVNYAYKAVRSSWLGLTGFHGHNNKGQALDNSLEAVDIGVDWVDGTVLGIGRGAGNTEIEYLLTELNKRNFEFELKSLYELVLNEFFSLKEIYTWGASLLYYLAAEYSIHPTFIQDMLYDEYSMDDILAAVFYLRGVTSNSFDKDIYKEALNVR